MTKIVSPTQICIATKAKSHPMDGFELKFSSFGTYQGSAPVPDKGEERSPGNRGIWLRKSSTGSSFSMRKLSSLVLAFKLHWHRICCCRKACNLSVCILLDGFRKLVLDVHVRLAPAK